MVSRLICVWIDKGGAWLLGCLGVFQIEQCLEGCLDAYDLHPWRCWKYSGGHPWRWRRNGGWCHPWNGVNGSESVSAIKKYSGQRGKRISLFRLYSGDGGGWGRIL